MEVFAVFDSKSDSFCLPFFEKSKSLGIRAFMGSVCDSDSKLNVFPDDFSLFHLSGFDEVTGVFSSFDSPVLLMSGIDALRQYRKMVSSEVN
ncbi:MAG: nonstructural protein [Microviridae sp.]|nr:MAG: nonstructural protein [Microviridae sp.]